MKTPAIYLVFGFLLLSVPAQADECGTTPGNLVANCGFETGTFLGWNLSGYQSSSAYLGVSHGVDSFDAHTGSYGAYLGGFGGVLNLDQFISTTPGTAYQISCWLAQSPATVAPYLSSFSTTFGGFTLFSAGDAPNLPYHFYSFSAVATSPLSLLNFGARDDTGFFSIDDVSVVPITTPEPSTLGLFLSAVAILYQFRNAPIRRR